MENKIFYFTATITTSNGMCLYKYILLFAHTVKPKSIWKTRSRSHNRGSMKKYPKKKYPGNRSYLGGKITYISAGVGLVCKKEEREDVL